MNLIRGLPIVSLTLLIVFATTCAFAGVPLVTSYQGRLLDGADQPLTGSYTMVFQIYDVPSGGAPLWTEDHVGVQVTDGLFSVALGATVPLSADLLTGSGGGGGGAGGFRYLQIQIAGQPAISPRTPLSSAPYAVASGSVSGDITTIPGGAIISNALGTRGLSLRATNDSASIAIDESGARRVKISSTDGSGGGSGGMISITGDPDFDLLRLTATQDSAKIRISGQSIGDPDFDLLRIVGGTGTGTAGASVTITGDPDFDLLRLSADHDSAKIRLSGKIIGDPDFDLLRLAGGSGASHLLMQSEPSGADARSQSLNATCDNTNARMAIKTKGTGAQREIRHNTDSLVAASSVEADLDADGVADLVVVSSTDATSAKHAINTKGTGANTGKTASLTMQATPGGSASAVLDIDDDGDSVPEGEISQLLTPTTSSVAIKTKGTGADANKTASLTVTGSPGGNVSSIGVADTDGDGTNDEEISQIITPTTSGVAIKTKGTGADKDRIALISSTTGFLIAGTASVVDDDGDGVPESEISQSLTPTTSSVAIKTKGTGADPNRSASLVCAADMDGDGTFDRSVSTIADSTTAGIAIDEPGAQVAMGMRKGWDGTIKGRFTVEKSATRMIELNSDGDGYFASKVGIGIDVPTHRIDVAGGAYCDGTNWVNASDASAKENFQPVDGEELLNQVAQLAITRWNYKGNAGVSHIGPTAQDFQAAFGVGSDGKSISTIDPAGIALAATKELAQQLKNKAERIDELESRVHQLQVLVEKLLAEKK